MEAQHRSGHTTQALGEEMPLQGTNETLAKSTAWQEAEQIP